MRVPRLFVPERLREGAGIDLPGEVAEHLGRVLRLGPGADLTLFDGEGGEWQATIEVLERGRVGVRVGSHRRADRESPLHLTLAQGISRGERMDYTLQKAVELGVSRIVPIASERSVVRLSAERGERRAEHWAKVVQAAFEQCGRTRVPRLLPVATMDEWMSGVVPGLKLLLMRREGACRLSELAPDLPSPC
jgi:16S rRNA (uracil1498-N3)-methyltransferase